MPCAHSHWSLLPAADQRFFELQDLGMGSGAQIAKAQALQLRGHCGHMATECESQKMTAAVRAFLAQ